jgi:hypothetical protein
MRGNSKQILILTSLLLAVSNCFGFSAFINTNIREMPGSYLAVVSQADGFVAITNDGRIDWISDKGTVTKTKSIKGEELQTALICKRQLIVSGVQGSLFYSENDTTFTKIDCGATQTIKCLAQFENQMIAGCGGGELRIGNPGNPFKSIRLELKGNIVSLSSGASGCYGLTDRGEIIYTTDGLNWTIFDFNDVYKGYYKACSFVKILAAANQIVVAGKNEDGLPVLFFSSKGNVWSERPLIYTDEKGFNADLVDIPNDIYYDNSKDQFILVCTNGKLMTIPSCSHCNKLYEISGNNLTGISGNENNIIVVGDNNYFRIITANEL